MLDRTQTWRWYYYTLKAILKYDSPPQKKNGSVFIFTTLLTNTATEACKSAAGWFVIKASTSVANQVKL